VPPSADAPYRLKVEGDGGRGLALAAFVRCVHWEGDTVSVRFVPLARASGAALQAAWPLLAAGLRRCGVAPERLDRPTRPQDPPLALDGGPGAQVVLMLALAAAATRPRWLGAVAQAITRLDPWSAQHWVRRLVCGPRDLVLQELLISLRGS
jgi:hypothetical protein